MGLYHHIGISSAEGLRDRYDPQSLPRLAGATRPDPLTGALPIELRDAVDRYWATFLGCERPALRAERPVILRHSRALADYRGLFIFQAGEGAPVVSLPEELWPALAPRAAAWPAALIRTPEALGAELAPIRPVAVIGPAHLGYTENRLLLAPPGVERVRQVTHADGPAVAALQAACAPAEWEHGGGAPEESVAFGIFDATGQLMSLGGYEVWDERLAHITFVTRPAFRDGGLGRAVVWAAARAALDAGLIPQHRTLETNGPALAVARALGFAPYGATLALQLPRF